MKMTDSFTDPRFCSSLPHGAAPADMKYHIKLIFDSCRSNISHDGRVLDAGEPQRLLLLLTLQSNEGLMRVAAKSTPVE